MLQVPVKKIVCSSKLGVAKEVKISVQVSEMTMNCSAKPKETGPLVRLAVLPSQFDVGKRKNITQLLLCTSCEIDRNLFLLQITLKGAEPLVGAPPYLLKAPSSTFRRWKQTERVCLKALPSDQYIDTPKTLFNEELRKGNEGKCYHRFR